MSFSICCKINRVHAIHSPVPQTWCKCIYDLRISFPTRHCFTPLFALVWFESSAPRSMMNCENR